jgi:hypothetical protein
MTIDSHRGASSASLHTVSAAADGGDVDHVASWAETALTVVATVVAIGVVSFVAVLMALA